MRLATQPKKTEAQDITPGMVIVYCGRRGEVQASRPLPEFPGQQRIVIQSDEGRWPFTVPAGRMLDRVIESSA